MFIRFDRMRCRICNSVSSGEIAGPEGDLHHKSFRPEKDGLGFLCSECDGSVTEVWTDYHIEDDLSYNPTEGLYDQ